MVTRKMFVDRSSHPPSHCRPVGSCPLPPLPRGFLDPRDVKDLNEPFVRFALSKLVLMYGRAPHPRERSHLGISVRILLGASHNVPLHDDWRAKSGFGPTGGAPREGAEEEWVPDRLLGPWLGA